MSISCSLSGALGRLCKIRKFDSGARADMGDDFGSGDCAELSAFFQWLAFCIPIEESRGELVACACGVDDFFNGDGIDFDGFTICDDDRAFFATCDGGDFNMFADCAYGVVEVFLHEEGFDFIFICEQNINVVFDQSEEVAAVAVNTEGVR